MTKKIADGIWQINAFGNVFVVEHEGVVLIDAGDGPKTDKVFAGIEASGHVPTDIRDIYVTHYHSDHVGGLARLAEATKATVHAPAGEAEIIRTGAPTPPKKAKGLMGKIFVSMASAAGQSPAPVHEEVTGGSTLPDGTQVISTPGHTVDHVVYVMPLHGGVLFTGDAVLNFTTPDIVPVNEDFAMAEQSFLSLGRYDYEMVAFGHGRPITSGGAQKIASAATRRYGHRIKQA